MAGIFSPFLNVNFRKERVLDGENRQSFSDPITPCKKQQDRIKKNE